MLECSAGACQRLCEPGGYLERNCANQAGSDLAKAMKSLMRQTISSLIMCSMRSVSLRALSLTPRSQRKDSSKLWRSNRW